MNYDLSSTLTENLQTINEQTLQDYEGNSEQNDSEKKKRELEYEESREYPNYCPAKEFATEPPQNKLGAEGVEALPPDHCYYSTPHGGLFIPIKSSLGNSTVFKFIDFSYIERISLTVLKKAFSEERIKDKGYDQNEKIKNKLYDEYKDLIKNSIAKSLQKYLGEIYSFQIGNDEYHLFWRATPLSKDVTEIVMSPIGYNTYKCPEQEFPCKTDSGVWYKNPEEVDRRSEFDRFIDDWSVWIQLGVAAAAIITTLIFPGSGAVIFVFEVAVEVGFGIADAVRALHAGNEVSAALSLMFAFIPIAFLRPGGASAIGKFFSRGIDMVAASKLSQRLLSSNLTETSNWYDWYKFWEKSSKEERILIEQLLEQDDVAKDVFFKKITKEAAEALTDPKTIKEGLKGFWNEYKLYVKNGVITQDALPAFKKMWVREVTLYGTSMVLAFISEMVGAALDQNVKTEVEWIGKYIPESQLPIIMAADPNNANALGTEVINHPQYQEVKKLVSSIPGGTRTDSAAVNINRVLDFATADSLRNLSINPITPVETFIPLETLNSKELQQKRNEGWISITELDVIDYMNYPLDSTNIRVWNESGEQKTYVYWPNYKKPTEIVISGNKSNTDSTNIKK